MASFVPAASSAAAAKPSQRELPDRDALEFFDDVLAAIDSRDVMKLAALFAYDGFNALAFKIALGKKIFALANGNKAEAQKIVHSIVALVVERGTKVQKRGDLKMTPAAKARFNELVKGLSITGFSQGEGGTKPSAVVTLQRIATVLVLEIGMVLAKHPEKARVGVSGLPACLSMPGQMALIPSLVAPDAPLIQRIFDWNLAFAKLVNQPDTRETQENIVKFMGIARAGNLYTDSQRMTHMRNLMYMSSNSDWATLLGADTYKAISEYEAP